MTSQMNLTLSNNSSNSNAKRPVQKYTRRAVTSRIHDPSDDTAGESFRPIVKKNSSNNDLFSSAQDNDSSSSNAKLRFAASPLSMSYTARPSAFDLKPMSTFYIPPSVKDDEQYVVEEAHEDCVYLVTVKKVYANANNNKIDTNNNNVEQKRPSAANGIYRPLPNEFRSYIANTEQQQQPETTSNNNNITNGLIYSKVKTKQLKFATLEKFIGHLTNEKTGELESKLVQTFLATYRTFTDAHTFLAMLRARYEDIVPASLDITEDVRVEHLRSIRAILRIWLLNYSEDFNEPPEFATLNALKQFVLKYMADSDLVQIIQSHFDQFNKGQDDDERSGEPSPVTPPNHHAQQHRRTASNTIPIGTKGNNITSSTTSSHQLSTSSSNKSIYSVDSLNNSSHLKEKKNASQNSLLLFESSTTPDSSSASYPAKFMSINSAFFAEQLTYIDKELFQKIIAHHCLGSVWSTRYQKNKNAAAASASASSSTPNMSSSFSQQQQQQTSTTPVLAEKFASIGAFIDQFNCVSFVVQSTILEHSGLSASRRAKIIEKWIDIARYCRQLKNFSSLNAIIQGLNTQCVSRLTKTWDEVSEESKDKFNELTELFSQDQNQKLFRETLMKELEFYSVLSDSDDDILENNYNSQTLMEGTAKFAEISSGINATLSRKTREKMQKLQLKNRYINEPLGTVPFLGTFLKDLEYINAQNHNRNEKGLINVLQKKREFDVVAQIKLLQRASMFYNITADPNFNEWLHQQPVYSEQKNYELSYVIEPKIDNSGMAIKSVTTTTTSTEIRHRKNKSSSSLTSSIDSITSYHVAKDNNNSANKTPSSQSKQHSRNSSSGSSDLFNNNANNTANNLINSFSSSVNNANTTQPSSSALNGDRISNLSAENNTSFRPHRQSSSLSSSSPHQQQAAAAAAMPFLNMSQSSTASSATSTASATTPSFMMVKVNIEGLQDSTVLYKGIRIKDCDRTREVKRSILEKFQMEPEICDKFNLVQVFNPNADDSPQDKRELLINDNCNVYYAARRVKDMHFVLRRRLVSSATTYIPNSGVNLNMKASAASPYSTSAPLSNRQQHKSSTLVDKSLTPPLSSNKTGTLSQLPPQSPHYHSKKQSSSSSSNHSNYSSFSNIFSSKK